MIDIPIFLAAIAMIESGDRDHLVGRSGERSRYQIMERTWKQHSDLPFAQASDPEKAREVATAHVVWLQLRLPLHTSPGNLAMAWKVGLTNYKQGHWTMKDEDYVARFKNLYEEGLAHQRVHAGTMVDRGQQRAQAP